MIVTVSKIGEGIESDPFRPDTDAHSWQLIEERDTEMVIEILDG